MAKYDANRRCVTKRKGKKKQRHGRSIRVRGKKEKNGNQPGSGCGVCMQLLHESRYLGSRGARCLPRRHTEARRVQQAAMDLLGRGEKGRALLPCKMKACAWGACNLDECWRWRPIVQCVKLLGDVTTTIAPLYGFLHTVSNISSCRNAHRFSCVCWRLYLKKNNRSSKTQVRGDLLHTDLCAGFETCFCCPPPPAPKGARIR